VDRDGLLDLVAARARLIWHIQAELWHDLWAVVEASQRSTHEGSTHSGPARDEEEVVDEVGTEIGWLLHCSERYAFAQVATAGALTCRLPMVLADVRAGLIDPAKAEAFVDALGCVSVPTAHAIAIRLLPKARRWTLAELRAALRYHVDRSDPAAARRRYTKRVAERDVWLRANPDGTATLSGHGLAPHRAAAAFDRIDRLARAARAQGDERNLAQLRGDAMCDLLAGMPFQLAPGMDPVSAEADRLAVVTDAALTCDSATSESRFGSEKDGEADGHDSRLGNTGGTRRRRAAPPTGHASGLPGSSAAVERAGAPEPTRDRAGRDHRPLRHRPTSLGRAANRSRR
jgi:hypothetical protein